MAFDAFTDKNAVFRRLKARPENKVLVTSPLSSSSSPSPPAAMPSPLRPSLASAAHPIPPPRRPRLPPRRLPLGPLAVSPSIPHILHDSPLAAAMAPKKIREYDSKRLLKEHLKRLAGIDLQILSAQAEL